MGAKVMNVKRLTQVAGDSIEYKEMADGLSLMADLSHKITGVKSESITSATTTKPTATTSSSFKPIMAALDFYGSDLDASKSEYLINIFASELTKSTYRNDYTLITRTKSALNKAKLDTTQISAIGKEIGADLVFYGTVDNYYGKVSVTINILDVKTGKIIATANTSIKTIDNVRSVSSKLTAELIEKLKSNK